MVKITSKQLWIMGFLAVVIIYLFGQIMPSGVYEQPTSEQLSSMTLWVVRLGTAVAGVWLSSVIISKATGKQQITKQDFLMFAIVVAVVYFSWEYIISSIVKAPSLADISWNFVKLAGIKP